jgi:hypothetical protein
MKIPNAILALFLVSQGASVNDVDKHNKSIAHQASYSGMNTLLRRVLEKGCDKLQCRHKYDTQI